MWWGAGGDLDALRDAEAGGPAKADGEADLEIRPRVRRAANGRKGRWGGRMGGVSRI